MISGLLRNRRVRRLRRFLTPDGFALAPVWMQLGAIFVGSALLILLLSPLIGSLALSYRLFTDPSSYGEIEGLLPIIPGLVQVMFGLILFSFIISVLSAASSNSSHASRAAVCRTESPGTSSSSTTTPSFLSCLTRLTSAPAGRNEWRTSSCSSATRTRSICSARNSMPNGGQTSRFSSDRAI